MSTRAFVSPRHGVAGLGSAPCFTWFRTALDDALAKAGVDGNVRIHDLRHTALTNMAAAGASPIAVMATAGHRSMQTTQQYVHLAGVVFRDEASALERRLGLVPKSGTEEPETALVSQEH